MYEIVVHINIFIQTAAVSIANFQNFFYLSKSDFTLHCILGGSPHCDVNELSHPKLISLGLKETLLNGISMHIWMVVSVNLWSR